MNYIRNITDIDDKIIKRAEENGEDIQALTERYIEAMNEDTDALNMIRPDSRTRATDHIEQIINMISQLEDKDYAYAADNGDVYFAVNKYKNYGQLSGKKIDELRAGERVAVDEAKRDPLDFVLWKASKPGEPSWGSPWGPGRPGWHIECSAMSIHAWVKSSTSTAAVRTCNFPTTKMKLPNRAAPLARSLSICGCIMALCVLMMKRCPNPWAISSLCVKC